MKRSIRLVVIFLGAGVSLFGAVKDNYLFTIGGALLVVIGFMYPVILGVINHKR